MWLFMVDGIFIAVDKLKVKNRAMSGLGVHTCYCAVHLLRPKFTTPMNVWLVGRSLVSMGVVFVTGKRLEFQPV